MEINSAEFVTSNTELERCPAPKKPEYAFIGRSNVGKSSLINMMTKRKGLAKTSGRPGKTQLINHFIINDEWYLVDLPGYGYAKTSKTDRKTWAGFTREYLMNRTNLMNVFVLLDSRLPAQKVDLDFLEFLGASQIPFSIVFTKMDKLRKTELVGNLERIKNTLLESWEELPPCFETSATASLGGGEILDYIEQTNHLFKPE